MGCQGLENRSQNAPLRRLPVPSQRPSQSPSRSAILLSELQVLLPLMALPLKTPAKPLATTLAFWKSSGGISNQQAASITWYDLCRPNFGQKTPENYFCTSDVWEPLKQVLWASRDVIISSQICGSNVQRFCTLGDGCWLPIKHWNRQKTRDFKAPTGDRVSLAEPENAREFWWGLSLVKRVWVSEFDPQCRNPCLWCLPILSDSSDFMCRKVA